MTAAIMNIGLAETGFASVGSIKVGDRDAERIKINIPILDQLFGGKGLMPGMSILISAPAGAGKTTLMLQMLEAISNGGNRGGYVSGEESVDQLAYNAKRIGVKNVQVANMADVDKICDEVMPRFKVIVIDSFQCLYSNLVKGINKTQLYSIARIVSSAKKHDCVVFSIVHLTKDGKMKGDSTIMHSVDCKMLLRKGDGNQRIVEIEKNRFGATGEITLNLGANGYNYDPTVTP